MLTLKRKYLDTHTEGKIILPNGEELFTLERPWKGNKQMVSCIPEGEYIVVRDHTGRHKYFSVKDVVGRSAIEIHPANVVSELAGCIAPCLYLKDGKGYHSTEACLILIELFGEKAFHLVITS